MNCFADKIIILILCNIYKTDYMKREVLMFGKLVLAVFIAGYLLTSCSGDEEKTQKPKIDSTKTKEQGVEIYKIPSPIELYQFMKDNGSKFKKDLMGNPEVYTKYVTTKARALNFGLYASDLAYCTVFERSQETFTYFKSAKSLADGLGLSEGFDDIVSKRLNNNMNNTDSLYEISNDAYSDACDYLIASKKSDILAYILVGSFIESLHISVNSVAKFSENDMVVQRIAEQQLILENLNSSLEQIKKDADFEDMKTKMKNLQTIFDKLYQNTDALITKEQFNEISKFVKDFRKEMIG